MQLLIRAQLHLLVKGKPQKSDTHSIKVVLIITQTLSCARVSHHFDICDIPLKTHKHRLTFRANVYEVTAMTQLIYSIRHKSYSCLWSCKDRKLSRDLEKNYRSCQLTMRRTVSLKALVVAPESSNHHTLTCILSQAHSVLWFLHLSLRSPNITTLRVLSRSHLTERFTANNIIFLFLLLLSVFCYLRVHSVQRWWSSDTTV